MDDFVALLFGVAQQLGNYADVLVYGHVGEQAYLLNDIADLSAQLYSILLGHVLAIDEDRTGFGFDQTVDGP